MASSYYDLQAWQAPQRQASWDQAQASRSGASSVISRDEVVAFSPQFEEVDRAIDNLAKSGKLLGRGSQYGPPGRPYGGEFDHRPGSRPQSMDFDPMRASHGPNNLQSFYGNARYPPRSSEGGDPMQQAKRRMAAARERELRNYHQEQQYNRSITTTQGKPDRSASPSTMNDEDRRELLARQHKALYGDHGYPGQPFGDENQTPRPSNSNMIQNDAQDARVGTDTTTSSTTNVNNFGAFDQSTTQQSSRTSTSPANTSPPTSAKPGGAPGAIGTRPSQAANPSLVKRATPPSGSPLTFGFGENNQAERAGSAASNPQATGQNLSNSGTWGTGSGVWGKGSLTGVSSTVWG